MCFGPDLDGRVVEKSGTDRVGIAGEYGTPITRDGD
jgi:hypothetical protein